MDGLSLINVRYRLDLTFSINSCLLADDVDLVDNVQDQTI